MRQGHGFSRPRSRNDKQGPRAKSVLVGMITVLRCLPLGWIQNPQVINFLLGKLHNRPSQKSVFLYSTGCIYKVCGGKPSLLGCV